MHLLGNALQFDVIVCGAGHAGCEAALAAARMGATTLLLSGNLDTIAQMSCNPAIGGQAKGHIVREIDALGGEMAINTDTTGIQFRLLNSSKGPAVQAPRAQCDKKAYQFRMKHTLELHPNLQIVQATATKVLRYRDCAVGVATNLGVQFQGAAVVLTTGTFLRALMHVGDNRTEGGRMGDFSARDLSASLAELGIELLRLKTGTPPRILGRTINFSAMEEQRGDPTPTLFAFHDTRDSADLFHVEHSNERRLGWTPGSNQVSCWLTHTTPDSAQIVRDNLKKSALYGGMIEGVGPRYCPSIEDKIVRFAEKPRHQVFLEPEGRHTNEYYANGLSTSLPMDVQGELIRSVPGLEQAQILRPAYAVEYDFAPPTQITSSLESRKLSGLFFAGQINGTSGYEEAAGQGIVAGINAALKTSGRPPIVLRRDESYIGVLIDDLTTKGTLEPYRMFTSRAEHRLLLNHGSAELRLLTYSERCKLLSHSRLHNIRQKQARVVHWVSQLEVHRHQGESIGNLVRMAREGGILPAPFLAETPEVQEEVLYRVRYRGYIERELRVVERMRGSDSVQIPDSIDYQSIRGLRAEAAQKLNTFRPSTIGQASRISGVNPADVSILMVYSHAARGAGR
jgi:tRNA uridine 5-carboxymethylaminomethyl modification enzyme